MEVVCSSRFLFVKLALGIGNRDSLEINQEPNC